MHSARTVKMRRITRPLPYVERRQVSWLLVASIIALVICLSFLSYEVGQLEALNRLNQFDTHSTVVNKGDNGVYTFHCSP